MQKKLAIAKMTDVANAFTDALGSGLTIEEAAHKAGMKYGRIAALDEQGLDPAGQKVGTAASDPEFLKAAFTAEVGEDGDPFPTAAGNYYALKVDGVTPPKVKPLDAVKTQAIALWTGEQAAIQLRAKAAALVAKANADHSLDDIAKALGVPVQSSPRLTRQTNDATFSQALIHALYIAPPGRGDFRAHRRWRLCHRAGDGRAASGAAGHRSGLSRRRAAAFQRDRRGHHPLARQDGAGQGRRQGQPEADRTPRPAERTTDHERPMAIEPEFSAFAAGYDAKKPQAVYTRLIADLETPVSAFLKTR